MALICSPRCSAIVPSASAPITATPNQIAIWMDLFISFLHCHVRPPMAATLMPASIFCRTLDRPQNKNPAFGPRAGYIVCGCRERKREFRFSQLHPGVLQFGHLPDDGLDQSRRIRLTRHLCCVQNRVRLAILGRCLWVVRGEKRNSWKHAVQLSPRSAGWFSSYPHPMVRLSCCFSRSRSGAEPCPTLAFDSGPSVLEYRV